MNRIYFPFVYRGKRYFAEIVKIGRDGLFRIKQTIPQIKELKPSALTLDLKDLPGQINPDSDILTLRILDGLRVHQEKMTSGN